MAPPVALTPPQADGGQRKVQPIQSAKSVVQGDRQRRETAQSVMPLPAQGGPPPPGTLTSLTAPTERGAEPVTTGLPLGPGAGPEALVSPAAVDDALWELRALAQRFPSRDMARIIAMAEERL